MPAPQGFDAQLPGEVVRARARRQDGVVHAQAIGRRPHRSRFAPFDAFGPYAHGPQEEPGGGAYVDHRTSGIDQRRPRNVTCRDRRVVHPLVVDARGGHRVGPVGHCPRQHKATGLSEQGAGLDLPLRPQLSGPGSRGDQDRVGVGVPKIRESPTDLAPIGVPASKQTTSCPRRSSARATASPTTPAPTMATNTLAA
ncbi:hypothetical protein GCM10029964_029060 [Kibdelosporangium lantanae]